MRSKLLGMAALATLATTLVVWGLFAYGSWITSRVETQDQSSLVPLPGARFVQTRSGRVHVMDIGEGPPILLMHGSGRGLVDWQQGLAQRLAENHRVIAFDYYGNGFSERNAEFTYGYDLWVNEAVDLLDALGIERVSVVGHSVGGALACILAADHPDRVDRVVTIGTGMEIEPQQFLLAAPGVGEATFANMPHYGRAYSDGQKEALEAAFGVKGTRAALLQYIRRQMTVDGLRLITGVFEDVRAPVLHLSGSEDENISPGAARALSLRTGGRFEVVGGVGHDVHILAPDQTAASIELFLSEGGDVAE
jgi:pimeloyl-ACP methyl ester carboxylesterase